MIERAGSALHTGRPARWPWPGSATALGIAAVVAIYAIMAWDRRWIADDGLIVVRSGREILAGHGPVYSAFERAEPTTSTLWLWLLAGCSWIAGDGVAQLALEVGGLLAVGGLAIALDATRRFHRASGHAGGLWPAGAWVVIGMFPFWDFATSGLETGLAFFWLAGIWWLLVTLRPDSGRHRLAGFAVFVGLGPLVRPELALAVAVGRRGVGGAVAPIDGIVVDRLGLANPLGARITPTQPGRTGHEKSLPWAWILADFADPSTTPEALRPAVQAARHAMTCGELAELLASVRAPMTASRFWANLTGALRRTRLIIPADPALAERALCGP